VQFDFAKTYQDYENQKREIWTNFLSFYYWSTFPSSEVTFALSFAWENERFISSIRESALQKIKDTTHLVIVGYSFPTFNRKIDKEILSKMPDLKKVFIQTMKSSLDEINYRFQALLGKERLTEREGYSYYYPAIEIELIEMNTGKEEFYIPFEFLET
jgi:hypothetical protein